MVLFSNLMDANHCNSSPSIPIHPHAIHQSQIQSERCIGCSDPRLCFFAQQLFDADTVRGRILVTKTGWVNIFWMGWNHQPEEQFWLLASFGRFVMSNFECCSHARHYRSSWVAMGMRMKAIFSRFNVFEKCVKSKIDFKDFSVSAVSLIEQTWTQQFILAARSLSHGTPCSGRGAKICTAYPGAARDGLQDVPKLTQSGLNPSMNCDRIETHHKTSKLAKTRHLWWWGIVLFFLCSERGQDAEVSRNNEEVTANMSLPTSHWVWCLCASNRLVCPCRQGTKRRGLSDYYSFITDSFAACPPRDSSATYQHDPKCRCGDVPRCRTRLQRCLSASTGERTWIATSQESRKTMWSMIGRWGHLTWA